MFFELVLCDLIGAIFSQILDFFAVLPWPSKRESLRVLAAFFGCAEITYQAFKTRAIQLIMAYQVAVCARKPGTAKCDMLVFDPFLGGVKPVAFLRNLVVYRGEPITTSMLRSGRIAPVVHRRRPHNIP